MAGKEDNNEQLVGYIPELWSNAPKPPMPAEIVRDISNEKIRLLAKLECIGSIQGSSLSPQGRREMSITALLDYLDKTGHEDIVSMFNKSFDISYK